MTTERQDHPLAVDVWNRQLAAGAVVNRWVLAAGRCKGLDP